MSFSQSLAHVDDLEDVVTGSGGAAANPIQLNVQDGGFQKPTSVVSGHIGYIGEGASFGVTQLPPWQFSKDVGQLRRCPGVTLRDVWRAASPQLSGNASVFATTSLRRASDIATMRARRMSAGTCLRQLTEIVCWPCGCSGPSRMTAHPSLASVVSDCRHRPDISAFARGRSTSGIRQVGRGSRGWRCPQAWLLRCAPPRASLQNPQLARGVGNGVTFAS